MLHLKRRNLLLIAGGVSISGSLLGWPVHGSGESRVGQETRRNRGGDRFSYFTNAEADFVDAAVSRLIPSDDLGAGAREAGVTFFIDQQLSGPFGKATDWYMQGPWHAGTPQQGFQSEFAPARIYRAAIEGVDALCGRAPIKSTFAAATAQQQDDVLHALEKDAVTLSTGVSGKTFFDLLWQNTQEGFFADPMYGGNRDFAGWKLVGYPGSRYNYLAEVGHFGERYPLPPVGILGRDASRRLGATS